MLHLLICIPPHGGCNFRSRWGYRIDEVVLTVANPAVGAAALAAVGSGLVKSWERYYRMLDKQAAEAEEEEVTNDE